MRLTAIALGAVVFFLSQAFSPAVAQDGQKLAAGAVQASKEFTSYLDKTAAAKAKPDLFAPPAAPLFARIFDTKGLATLPPPTAKDLSWSSEWLGASASSYMALINFNTNPQAPDYQKVLEENVLRHEDEISNAMNFMLRLMPRVVVSARTFMQGLSEAERNQPTRQQGVKNIRDGYMQTVSGATSFMTGGVKVPNARLVARALSDTVAEWRDLASPDERKQLGEVIDQARKNMKDAEAETILGAISSALGK
jgi:hypothetical protein